MKKLYRAEVTTVVYFWADGERAAHVDATMHGADEARTGSDATTAFVTELSSDHAPDRGWTGIPWGEAPEGFVDVELPEALRRLRGGS